jgi:hypothetical protein
MIAFILGRSWATRQAAEIVFWHPVSGMLKRMPNATTGAVTINGQTVEWKSKCSTNGRAATISVIEKRVSCLKSSPLIQGISGDIVILSLGGGQGNETTDPSAHSDLKGHKVGTRSAETHEILSPSCGDKPEIPRQSLGHPRFSKDSMAGSIFQDWRINVCVGSRLNMRTR